MASPLRVSPLLASPLLASPLQASPLTPAKSESEGDLFDIELDRLAEDTYFQTLWLSPSFLPFLDSCFPGGLLEVPDNSDLPPFQFQTSSSSSDQGKPTLLPSPCSLLNIFSTHKRQGDPQQLAADLQLGALGTFLISVPDGGDRPESSEPPRRHSGVIHSYEPDVRFETHCARPPSPTPSLSGKGVTLGLHSSSPEWTERCSAVPGPPAILEKTAGIQQTHLAARKEHCWSQLGRQTDLEGRALLAEHAMLHCSQQLPGLKERETPDTLLPAAVEPREMRMRNKAVQRRFCQEYSFDSEATASSSSSDDDGGGNDPEVDRNQQRPLLHCSSQRRRDNQEGLPASPTSNEVRWLGERAEIGSGWIWLLLRLAELEGRIQHLVALHKQLRSTKVGVVLGDSQLLTYQQQIQQTLLKETLGLSYRVRSSELPRDAGCEPNSPTRLLRNIERQSAQLSQIVTSLSAFSSPLSKPPHTWMGVTKRACYSDQGADGKRRRLGIQGRRRLLWAPPKGWCARARPLLAYHKHRLFTMEEPGTGALQDNQSTSPPYSSSCEPVALCAKPTCHSTTSTGGSLARGTPRSKRHPVLSHSSNTPFCSHFQKALPGERWCQRPMGVSVAGRPCDPTSHWDGHSDEEGSSYLLCGHQEISELLEEAYTQYPKHTRRLASQVPVHRRQGETVYGINNIIIPVSLTASAKVERKQYKHILTPSWRPVAMQSSPDTREEEEEEGVEVVTDEAFLQRHLEPEQREMQHWSSWRRRPASGAGPSSWPLKEERSMEASSALLEMDEHPGTEEKLTPASPWEPRLFPLAEAAEEALPAADVKESTALSRAGPFSVLSSYGASSAPSAGRSRNSTLPMCS